MNVRAWRSLLPMLFVILLALVLLAQTVAADKCAAAGKAGPNEDTALTPGTRCVVTAELECEVRAVEGDTVVIAITALRDVQQGVPALDKVPYITRIFKNSGTVSQETDVLLRIPKQRIGRVRPLPPPADSPQ